MILIGCVHIVTLPLKIFNDFQKYRPSVSKVSCIIKNFQKYHPSVTVWKKFCDDVFLVWTHSEEDLDLFF